MFGGYRASVCKDNSGPCIPRWELVGIKEDHPGVTPPRASPDTTGEQLRQEGHDARLHRARQTCLGTWTWRTVWLGRGTREALHCHKDNSTDEGERDQEAGDTRHREASSVMKYSTEWRWTERQVSMELLQVQAATCPFVMRQQQTSCTSPAPSTTVERAVNCSTWWRKFTGKS